MCNVSEKGFGISNPKIVAARSRRVPIGLFGCQIQNSSGTSILRQQIAPEAIRIDSLFIGEFVDEALPRKDVWTEAGGAQDRSRNGNVQQLEVDAEVRDVVMTLDQAFQAAWVVDIRDRRREHVLKNGCRHHPMGNSPKLAILVDTV